MLNGKPDNQSLLNLYPPEPMTSVQDWCPMGDNKGDEQTKQVAIRRRVGDTCMVCGMMMALGPMSMAVTVLLR